MADEPNDDGGGVGVVLADAPADVVIVDPKEDSGTSLRRLENEVFTESLEVLEGAMRFGEVFNVEAAIASPEKTVPDGWIEKYGAVKALRQWRLACLANLPKAEAPIGLDIAVKVSMGILKARTTEDAGPKELNLTLVAMTSPAALYPEKEVDDE